MSKKYYLTFETSLTDICEVNSSFDKGLLRICYTGENRNKSFISREDLERCARTLPYVPVVGNYIRSEEDFGGHDVEIITTRDGELKMVNKTQPVGVVPADADIYFETVEDSNGEAKEYLYTTVLLWKRQEAYKKIKEEGTVSHSMEITVKDGEMVDGVYHIHDFEFTALCLLGANVEPCFEDSSLEVFTTSDFKMQFELMMNDFKQSFNLATTSIEDNYSQDETLEEGGEEDLEKNKDVFTEEEVIKDESVEEEVFDTEAELSEDINPDEAVSVDEAKSEAEFETISEEDNEEELPKDEDEEDSEKDFALTGDISKALWESLYSADRIQDGELDWCRYFFVDFDIEKGVVYFEDALEDWKLFGCNYSMNGDNVVIDFDSKRRMKYSIVEFDEGTDTSNILSMYETIQKDSEERAESKYETTIKQYEAELEELRSLKADLETTAEINARSEIIADFDDLIGVEEFTALCDNMLDYDVDTFEEKCYAIRGRNISNPTSAKFSISDNMPKFHVESNGVKEDAELNAPYGGVVEKYRQA